MPKSRPKCLSLRIFALVTTNFRLRHVRQTLEQLPSHTCCRGNLQIRWPLGACRQVCLGRARHPAPVSATPSYDRVAPAVPSPAPADGLSPSALVGRCDEGQDGRVAMTVVVEKWLEGRGRSGRGGG